MDKFLIAGNWKMNTAYSDGNKLLSRIVDDYSPTPNVDVLICPPFTHIYSFIKNFNFENLYFGAQNCHFEESGAYTGEISASMLNDIGCRYVIVGHSERRAMFGETDITVNHKVKSALKHGIVPIFCLGETLEERESGKTYEVLERQLSIGLDNITSADAGKIVVAYEPVWAIGTGVSASVGQADEAHNFIREELLKKIGDEAENIKILYGGSMKPSNAEQLLKLSNVNGGLIGGASLKPDDFTTIINIANKLNL